MNTSTSRISFSIWRNDLNTLFLVNYAVTIADIGFDHDELIVWYEHGEAPADVLKNVVRKFDLVSVKEFLRLEPQTKQIKSL